MRTTIKYLRGAADIDLGTTGKFLLCVASATAGNCLGSMISTS